MSDINHLLEQNRLWAERMRETDPGFFDKLVNQQKPEYLWIGCSDSRVPANQIVGLLPGDIFVHRNVANLVVHTDFNCFSVIQYAVEVLKVKHIIVCGHYGCGGVEAAMAGKQLGLIDSWLAHIQDQVSAHVEELECLEGEERLSRMCELNVLAQTNNLYRNNIVKDALARGQDLTIHSWIYSIKTGQITDLTQPVSKPV